MGFSRWLTVTAAVALLAACGDGGASGSGGITPTPTPTPTTTPSPTPTPVSSARVFGIGPGWARLDFYDGASSDAKGNALVQGFTARDGYYFASYRNAILGYVGVAAGGSTSADYATSFKSASFYDYETMSMLGVEASGSYRMVNPVTELLAVSGANADKLKTQLGINGSLFAMTSNPDLATYDAPAEFASGDNARMLEASRFYAANIRVLAIRMALEASGQGGLLNGIPSLTSGGASRLAGCMRDAPNQFVFQNAVMAGILECAWQSGTIKPSSATFQAIAHVVDAYAAAVPVSTSDSNLLARYLLGIRGYLEPLVTRLAGANSAAENQIALNIGSPQIINETLLYEQHLRRGQTGFFFPQADFYALASGGSLTIPALRGGYPYGLRENDFLLSNVTGSNGGFVFRDGTVQSVSVPAANAGQITATFGAGETVTLTAGSAFKGASYFDYVTRSSNGEELTVRAYVRVY